MVKDQIQRNESQKNHLDKKYEKNVNTFSRDCVVVRMSFCYLLAMRVSTLCNQRLQ